MAKNLSNVKPEQQTKVEKQFPKKYTNSWIRCKSPQDSHPGLVSCIISETLTQLIQAWVNKLEKSPLPPFQFPCYNFPITLPNVLETQSLQREGGRPVQKE